MQHSAAGQPPPRLRAPSVSDRNGSLSYTCGVPLVARVLAVYRSILQQSLAPNNTFQMSVQQSRVLCMIAEEVSVPEVGRGRYSCAPKRGLAR